MPTFEQIGRKIDGELAKLRRYLEKEIEPATRRKVEKALRVASKKLAEAARELDARVEKMKK